MEACTKKESEDLSCSFGSFIPKDGLEINMTIEEEVYRFIPFPIKLLKCIGVPPVFVKFTIL